MSLRDLTRQTISVAPTTGTDADNRPTFDPPSQYLARVQVEDQVRETVDGSEHVEVVTAYIDRDATAIERGDQLTVDATGKVAYVVNVYPAVDGRGRVHHTKVVAE